jgi:VanZ family protein
MQNKKWIFLLILSILSLVTILVLAYTKGIPSEIVYIPYYDKIGHIFLYGLFAYVIHRASNRRTIRGIPLGIAAFTTFTISEEYIQSFSVNRTASISDLIFSLSGIALAYLIDRYLQNKK